MIQNKKALQFPPLPDYLEGKLTRGKFASLLRQFGPSAIVASLAIGAGETILSVRVGAWAEYDLLWLVLVAAITKAGFLTYLLGRYTALTGENAIRRLGSLPGPRGTGRLQAK